MLDFGVVRRVAIAAAAVSVLAVLVAACGSGGSGGSTGSRASTAPASQAPSRAVASVALAVPAAERGGELSAPRHLLLPRGWTARVWARVPDARMEAWAPGGGLLVSEPSNSTVVELTEGAGAVASVRPLLTGLTSPQGLAFARRGGGWVLYVGESDEIDSYPWRSGRIAGPRAVIAPDLPDETPAGDDIHRQKDVAVGADGRIYFDVGSSSNAEPVDRTYSPPRAVIEAVGPDGGEPRVVERGVRNGEGLARAPDGSVWTAVNNRDEVPYPFHREAEGQADAFGTVVRAYVDDHPPDEVVPVTQGRDLGWPYCNPEQGKSSPPGSLADVPLIPDAVTNPGATHLACAALPPIEVGLPAHSAPLGMSFLEGSHVPAPWSGGAVLAVHGSWDRQPPRPPAVLWLRWNAAKRTLEPAVTLAAGFQNPDGSRWGRPVDAVPGPEGDLYVSDDTAGAIYRLVPPR